MRWVRSWPLPMPAHRAYVMDELERLLTADDYDYTPLWYWFERNPDEQGVCLIEWDIALEPPQYELFASMAAVNPDRVLVAPQALHHVSPAGSVWAHRALNPLGGERWVEYLEPVCDYFAFGLIYFPRAAVQLFMESPAPERGRPLVAPGGYEDCRFTDQTFSVWHRHRYTGGGPVKIEWSIRPVHLHARGV